MSDEERLAAAQAELAALEGLRAERREAAQKRTQLEAAERAVADARALAAAEETLGFGKFAAVSTPLGVVIVKRPNAMQYRKFTAAIGDKFPIDELERLVIGCLVHPSKPEYATIADEYPQIPIEVGTLVHRLASGKAAETQEKS